MKNASIVACVFFLCSLGSVQVHAQQVYTGVYDLYYNLMLYPEKGDELIQQNQGFFDSQFDDCMNVVQERAKKASLEYTAYCEQLADPREYALCLQNDEAGKLWTWGRAIRSVIRGEVKWSDTMQALAAVSAKNMLGPAAYGQIVNSTVPNSKGLLVCKLE